MSKDTFPKWSPSDLVEKFHQMKNKLGSSSQPLDVMDDDDLKECNAYEKWKKDALKEEK